MVDPCTCPVCGGPLPELPGLQIIDGFIFFQGKHLLLARRTKQLFLFLYNHRGRFQTEEAILFHLYGDDPNGGPTCNIVGAYISRIRSWLRENNIRDANIETAYTYGYRLVLRVREKELAS